MSFKNNESYRSQKKIVQNAALVGFAISLAVHLAALKGEMLFPGAMILHLGVFAVFIPAIITLSNPANYSIRAKGTWKKILKGCPPWMIAVAIALAIYAFINFTLFIQSVPSKHSPAFSDPSTRVKELRGFSGHWMLFYWVAFSILYSHLNAKEPNWKSCEACGHKVYDGEGKCSVCGSITKN